MLYYSIQAAPPKLDAGLSSDHSDFPWIVFCCRKEVPAGFSNQFLNSRFHGNCNSWWSCRVTRVAPRIVLDVSYVTRINNQRNLSWHGRYLVKFEGDSWSSAHVWQGSIMTSCFMAGPIFGEVRRWLLKPRLLYWTFHVWRGWIMGVVFCGRSYIR